MNKIFLITPGEFEGVGLEVTLKALRQLDHSKDSFVIFSEQTYLEAHLKQNPLALKKIEKPQLNLKPGIYYVDPNKNPTDWFKEACVFCEENPENAALITGPLTKSSFSDTNTLGHTEYLRSLYPERDLFMTFFGEHYNCLLLNDHIPLTQVSANISGNKIKSAYTLISQVFNQPQIGLLGLNPHAGENSLLGTEEASMHNPICAELDNLEGPLSPDGFFSIDAYKKYDFIIANYHDQGLIPFKLINGFKASQATLGLPFVRTSVDHGTGSKLFMKNLANPDSMLHAIHLAQNLLQKSEESPC